MRGLYHMASQRRARHGHEGRPVKAEGPPPPSSPWEFRFRAFVSFIIYFVGFSAGWAIDGMLGGAGVPTYVLLGRRWGGAGIHAIAAIIAAFAVAGFLMRWWGSSYHQAGVVFGRRIETGTLTASGPYRYVRNPLYLGSMLQAVGISALGPPPATALILIAFTAFIYRLIFLEERQLRATQGDAYARYCAQVPRLVPRLRPGMLLETGQRPNTLYGFVTELGSFGFAVWLSYLGFVNPDERSRTFIALFYVAIALFIVGGVLNRRMSAAASARR